MKLKYLFIPGILFLLLSSAVTGQKSRITNVTELRRDSIVNLLKNFGQSADLYYDQYVTQRRGVDYLSNEDGKIMFRRLFLNPEDTCIVNYLDTVRMATIPFERKKGKQLDSVPESGLRYCNYLTVNEYMKLHSLLYSGGDGSSSELDTLSIRVIDLSEKKSFGNKYKIEVMAGLSFSGENDSLPERYLFENQKLLFSIIYEKYKIKDEVIFKNFRILKIRLRPSAAPGKEIPPIDSTHVFSLEPYIHAGIHGGNHTFAESQEKDLSGKAGMTLDFGVNMSLPFRISEDNKYVDLGAGIGYSALSLPVSMQNYEFVENGLTPPFTPSSFFKRYDYTRKFDQVDETHLLGFVTVPVFVKLRIPVAENLGAFFKLGFITALPVHSGYRADGEITYSGVFHYVINNNDVSISTDQNDGNLAASIPDYQKLYGEKESMSWEKLKKSAGFSVKLETGLIMKSTARVNYNVGAYVSYLVAGYQYGTGAELVGQEGKINSFLTKTDKIAPFGFGLTLSVSFNKFKHIFLDNQ